MTRGSAEVDVSVHAVLERYLSALDFGDYGALAECFTADATLTYDVRPHRFVGGRALASWVESAHLLHPGRFVHVLSSVAVTTESGKVSAKSHAVAYLASTNPSGPVVTVRGVRYEDEFRLVEDRWKISSRVHEPLWQLEIPGSPLAEIGSKA